MKEYLDILLDVVREGGQISLDVLDRMDVDFKGDCSPVTEADLHISKLVHEKLDHLLQTEEHILVDEEDPSSIRHLNKETLDKVKYIWSVDPIDGTRPFTNGVPTYGVSIGIVKDCKPWMGVVFFPLIEELFYCDGEDAYFVRHAFTDREIKRKIVPIESKPLTKASIFHCGEGFYRFHKWVSNDCHTMIPGAAVAHFCWPTIGRGIGSILRISLWDLAGSWPIFRKAGLDMRKYDTGEVIDSVKFDDFQHEKGSWKLKDFCIMSSEYHYPLIKERLLKLDPSESDV